MNFKMIEEYMTQFPIYQYTFLPIEDVVFDEKVRNFCKKECPHYGRSWSCPPAIGSVKQCKNKCMGYSHAILFSSVVDMPEPMNHQSIQKGKQEHEEITYSIEEFLNGEAIKTYTLTTEHCTICEKCAYPKKSCANPGKMHPCIESHGIDLEKSIQENHMDYFMGEHMVLLFSLIFIGEA